MLIQNQLQTAIHTRPVRCILELLYLLCNNTSSSLQVVNVIAFSIVCLMTTQTYNILTPDILLTMIPYHQALLAPSAEACKILLLQYSAFGC